MTPLGVGFQPFEAGGAVFGAAADVGAVVAAEGLVAIILSWSRMTLRSPSDKPRFDLSSGVARRLDAVAVEAASLAAAAGTVPATQVTAW